MGNTRLKSSPFNSQCKANRPILSMLPLSTQVRCLLCHWTWFALNNICFSLWWTDCLESSSLCSPTCVNATQPPDLTQTSLPQGLVQSPSQMTFSVLWFHYIFYFHYRFYQRLHEMAICVCAFFFLISHQEVFEVRVRVNFWIQISPIVPWMHFTNIYWIESQRDFW